MSYIISTQIYRVLNMEDHLRQILTYVIEQTVNTGEPVGSQYLVNEYKLSISPATVRNYFAVLEREGFITQPHTSSGRIPTEKGYQYYVQNILKPRTLSKKESSDVLRAAQISDIDDRQIKSLAKVISDLSQSAVIIGLNNSDSYYTGLSQLFTQPEFKDWNRIVSMSDILDRLDEVLDQIRNNYYENPTPLIGAECPFGPMCGSVMASIKGGYLIGILGPLRMDYGLSISLLQKIKILLEQ